MGRAQIVTALILLPVTYNADEHGQRPLIEDEKYFVTAEEISQEGGTIHLYRDGSVHGVWWDKGIVDRDTHAVIEVDLPDTTEARNDLERYVERVLLDRFHRRRSTSSL